ncbi:rCG41445, partial [Rattus norvegicus]
MSVGGTWEARPSRSPSWPWLVQSS